MEGKDAKYCKCLYYSASALARVISKVATEEFAITGLTPSYAFLLMTINSQPGIRPTEISEVMQLTPSTVTRLIEKMENRGFVERKSSGKFTEVYPTEKCFELDAKIKEAWMNLYHRYSDAIGEEEAVRLTSMIYEVRKKLT
jgi:DNA-binding MarR family transcriptional regulator